MHIFRKSLFSNTPRVLLKMLLVTKLPVKSHYLNYDPRQSVWETLEVKNLKESCTFSWHICCWNFGTNVLYSFLKIVLMFLPALVHLQFSSPVSLRGQVTHNLMINSRSFKQKDLGLNPRSAT